MSFLQNPRLPNYLTLLRLAVGPTLLPFLIVLFVPANIWWINWFVALIFFCFSMTDFLDGYLSRRYGNESVLGSALDPIADKFLVCANLIALLAIHKIYFFWVVLLVGREMCMMALRQFASMHQVTVHVTYLGKLKACLQMLLIIILIARPVASYTCFGGWAIVELLVLSLTLYLSLLSLYKYIRLFIAEYNRVTG